MVHFSFPIEKREDTATINPVDGTPDILITGKATDGTLDGDREIVDPEWSARAIQQWCDTGGNVRMSHDPKRPVGKGQHVQVTTDGHYVTSLIADPLAKHFIRTGVLNDYSVGISMPDFRYRDSKLDPQGKALRIITGRPDGQSRIAELSVVDRGSNFNSRFQMVRKSAGNGDGDAIVGTMIGDEDEIAKAAPASLTKMAHGDADTWTETSADMSGFQMPADLDITFTPADMARLMQAKVVEKHYAGLAAKAVAEPDAVKRDVSTAERRSLASEGNALPDGSYPINSAGDLHNAAHLARTGHGNAEAAKKLIARRARELGVANPLADDGDSASKGTVTDTAAKNASDATDEEALTMLKGLQTAMLVEERAAEAQKADAPAEETATPDVTKDPAPKPVKKAKKKPKGGKKLPPWLNKPADDEGSDDGKGSSGDSGACKSVTDHLWTGVEGTSDIECAKCHTTPAEAAGLSGTHDMTCAPVPELLESPPMASTKGGPTPASASGARGESMSPVPAHREPDGALNDPMEADMGASDGDAETPTRLEAGMMKSSPEVAAILRFRKAGIDAELGKVHDLTCPAYHPEDVAKCHPFADLSRIDADAFQREAVKAACGPDMERANSLNLAWQAAHVLKTANPAELNDYRLAAHKAFRDANPGPASAPTPGMIVPGRYNRPLITDGHEASSPAHDGPNSSPAVATSAPDAHSFDRPPLSAGHQSPSPSFMKASFEYPEQTGQPMRLDYAVMEKERSRHALMQMHEHLSRQFPEVCPMSLDAPPVQPESRGVPPTAGIGKGGGGGGTETALVVTAAAPPVAVVLKAPAEDDLVDDAVYKGFKKARKKLGKKVLSGSMTVDEARAKLGRQFAQKAAEPAEPAQKSAAVQVQNGNYAVDEVPGQYPEPVIFTTQGPVPFSQAAELMKAAASKQAPAAPPAPVAASFSPEDIEAAVTKAVTPLLEKIQQQDEAFTTKLAEQQRVIDAIADQPDPSTAAFSGLAFNPLRTTKSRRPAGVVDQADIAERTQQMVMRTLQDKYNSSSDPHEREAYYTTLSKMRGYSEP